MITKVCNKCKETKDISSFYKDTRFWRKPNSVRPQCKICDGVKSREWALKNRDKVKRNLRNWRLKRYSIDQQTFDSLLEKQRGICAACRTDNPQCLDNQWHIDHDHKCCPGKYSCGKCIRGLLCFSCNTALGLVQDEPKRLIALINYLKNEK